MTRPEQEHFEISLLPHTRKPLFFALAVGALAVLAGLAFYLEKYSPPRAARLLPEAEGIVFANLKPIRLATHLDTKPVPHSPEYQQFIDATGIVFERDLDSVAFALHRMPNPNGPNGPVAYSEVFVGHFDKDRLSRYLGSIASAHEFYAGHEIFTVPVGGASGPTGRMLRVAELSGDTIAVSNTPTPEQIHLMLDHYRSSANPFSGPTLLTGLFPDVPVFSPVWGIGALGLPFAEDGNVAVMGLHLPLPEMTPLIASLRYTTSLNLRIEEIAADDEEAARSAKKLTTLLKLLHQMQQIQSIGPANSGISEFANSIVIEHKDDRAILTAEIPLDLVRTLTSPALAGIAGH